MSQITCSFCGRDKKDVTLMISGMQAHICNHCITQSFEILNEEKKLESKSNTPNFKLKKPIEMKAFLDEYVIGQEEALSLIHI